MTMSMPDDALHQLSSRISQIGDSLLFGFQSTNVAQQQSLEHTLQHLRNILTLYEILSSFRKALSESRETLKEWLPKGLIEKVIRACCENCYGENDIEYIFYRHGGINGLLILFLGTRSQNALFRRLYSLPANLLAILANKCAEEQINTVVPNWIDQFNNSLTSASSPGWPRTKLPAVHDLEEEIPRLDRWRKKESREEMPNSPMKGTRSDVPTESFLHANLGRAPIFLPRPTLKNSPPSHSSTLPPILPHLLDSFNTQSIIDPYNGGLTVFTEQFNLSSTWDIEGWAWTAKDQFFVPRILCNPLLYNQDPRLLPQAEF